MFARDDHQTSQSIHVVSEFMNASGGTEWHALNLARTIRMVHEDVTCWNQMGRPDPFFSGRFGIRNIDTGWRGHAPRVGQLIVVGEWMMPGRWFQAMKVSRIVQVSTVLSPEPQERSRRALEAKGCPVDHVFICDAQRRAYGLEGPLHPAPVDIERFRPRPVPVREGRFVVGRMSRDTLDKHDFVQDPDLYRWLLGRGASVRLMGARCVAHMLPVAPGLEAMPVMTEPPDAFLHSLDCFFFRTGTWFDNFATVLFEAMACGIPVVAHRWGGYADYIKDGVDGFLFDSQSEAKDILARLQDDPGLRTRIGSQARASMEALYSPDAERARALHYLSPLRS